MVFFVFRLYLAGCVRRRKVVVVIPNSFLNEREEYAKSLNPQSIAISTIGFWVIVNNFFDLLSLVFKIKFVVVISVITLILRFTCDELRHTSDEIISMIFSVLVISLYIRLIIQLRKSILTSLTGLFSSLIYLIV